MREVHKVTILFADMLHSASVNTLMTEGIHIIALFVQVFKAACFSKEV